MSKSALPITSINGEIENQITTDDRGFLYGDGVFETVWGTNGVFPFLTEHRKRLMASCEKLAIPVRWENVATCLHRMLKELDEGTLNKPMVARIAVTRGSGPRGYQPPRDAKPLIAISLTPSSLQDPGTKLTLGLCKSPLGRSKMLGGMKHLNRLENVMLKRESSEAGFEDALVMDESGDVIETTSSNLFLIKRDRLITPKITYSGVSGVVRGLVIDKLAPELGLEVEETSVKLSDITRADELIITNAVFGPRRVSAVEGHRYYSTPIGQRLISRYARLRDQRLEAAL